MRSIGCAEFIWKFLLVQGPHGSPAIDPETGAPQADIFFYYKRALMRATAVDRATRLEEKQARCEQRSIDPGNIEKLAERHLARIPYKFQGRRFHSLRRPLFDTAETGLGGTYRARRVTKFSGPLSTRPTAPIFPAHKGGSRGERDSLEKSLSYSLRLIRHCRGAEPIAITVCS